MWEIKRYIVIWILHECQNVYFVRMSHTYEHITGEMCVIFTVIYILIIDVFYTCMVILYGANCIQFIMFTEQ